MTKLTPGPWHSVLRAKDDLRIMEEDAVVAIIPADATGEQPDGRIIEFVSRAACKRGMLIAAAPELLMALRGVLKAFAETRKLNPGDADAEWLDGVNAAASRCEDKIRAAIAKAEGK